MDAIAEVAGIAVGKSCPVWTIVTRTCILRCLPCLLVQSHEQTLAKLDSLEEALDDRHCQLVRVKADSF